MTVWLSTHSIRWEEVEVICEEELVDREKIKESLTIRPKSDNLNLWTLEHLLTIKVCAHQVNSFVRSIPI